MTNSSKMTEIMVAKIIAGLAVLLISNRTAEAMPPTKSMETSTSLFAQRRYKACIETATREIKANPNMISAYDYRGQSYYLLEDFDNAIADLNIYFKRTTGDGDICAHRLRGLALCQIGKIREALKDFDICCKAQPGTWDFWWDRANSYTELKEYDKAIFNANEMIKLKPDNARYAQRAKIYFAAGNYKLSLADWNKAISLCPSKVNYYGARAQCYEKLGRKDLADADKKKRDSLSLIEL